MYIGDKFHSEILRRAKSVLTDRRTDGRTTDGLPKNILPLPLTVGGGIEMGCRRV